MKAVIVFKFNFQSETTVPKPHTKGIFFVTQEYNHNNISYFVMLLIFYIDEFGNYVRLLLLNEFLIYLFKINKNMLK